MAHHKHLGLRRSIRPSTSFLLVLSVHARHSTITEVNTQSSPHCTVSNASRPTPRDEPVRAIQSRGGLDVDALLQLQTLPWIHRRRQQARHRGDPLLWEL